MSGPVFPSLLSQKTEAPTSRRRVIDAIYADSVLRPDEPLPLEDGSTLLVTVLPSGQMLLDVRCSPAVFLSPPEPQPQQMQRPDVPPSGALPGVWARRSGALSALSSSDKLAWILFGLGMLIYLFTRAWKITQFPIYFFTDEAANPLFARDLIEHGFRNAQGNLFPLYFEVAGNRWGPLFSVYIHAVSATLFGQTVVVTRLTQVFVSLLAPLATSMILKQVFKARFWWVGALLLAVAPAWFLHSRTGFETVMMSSFFACFLWFYLLYRTRSPRYLFAAIIFGALTFFTYSSGQMLMVSVGAVLAVSDVRYHFGHWRTTLPGLGLIALLALPALHFRATNPQFMTVTLRTMNSYWFHDLTLAQKIEQFMRSWAQGISPAYWFIPSQTLLVRHRMDGYGNLSVWLLPFFLIGVGWCLWKIKSPAPRALFLTALVTPMGAALVADVGITRVLAFTIPASLLIALGLEAVLDYVGRRVHVRYAVASAAVFGMLSVASLGMLSDALSRGPTWFRDYGLYGIQFGATQLFGETIPQYLAENTDSQIMVSPTWANGTEKFVQFFLSKEQQRRVQLLNVDYFMQTRRDLTPNMALVMTPEEYQRAQASGKFKAIDVLRTLPYPDGSPGFYLTRLAYVDNLDTIIQQEREARSQPVTETAEIDGQTVEVTHSQFDMGLLPNVFDGDTFTLVRGLEANPLILDFVFPEPRRITGLAADFGSMDFTLTAKLYAATDAEPKTYTQTFQGLPPDPHVDMAFESAPDAVEKLRLEVRQLNAPSDPHIHVRELKFAQ